MIRSDQHKNFQGFTIVELLIVIVVIAILASISVVAYNGIQQRAIASTAASTTSNLGRALASYFTVHGNYPMMETPGTMKEGCIGNLSDYPETAEFAAGECAPSIDDGSMQSVDEEMTADLKKLTSVPNTSLPMSIHPYRHKPTRGIYFQTARLTNGKAWFMFQYVLNGKQNCVADEIGYYEEDEDVTVCFFNVSTDTA